MNPNDNSSPAGPDGPDQEKMQQIRARRLAKLGGPPATKPDEGKAPETEASLSTAATPSTKTSATETETSKPPAPKINIAPQTSSKPSPQQGSGSSQPAEGMTSSGTSRRLARKRSASEVDDILSATPPRRPTPIKPESDEDYTDRMLTQIFRISVDPLRMISSQGNHRLTFLQNLNQELNDNQEPLKLTITNLDQAIIEACIAWPQKRRLLEYLMPCWKRAVKAATTARSVSGPRLEMHEESKRLCMSNCLFALTMPPLYGREPHPVADSLAPFFIRGPADDDVVDMEFLKEAVKRFDEDEAYPEIFTDALVQLSDQLSVFTMNDDIKPYTEALLMYTQFPVLMTNLSKHPRFNLAQSAHNIEKNTIFGPFFRLSPLQIEVAGNYFPSPRSLDKPRIRNAQDSLRMVVRTHQDDLFTICNAFIRNSPDTRIRVLNWFAYLLNMNHKRRAMQVNPREIASDGFMMNVTAILDRFCEPFMDNDFSKVEKIDARYLRRQSRINIRDETKLNADQAAADNFYGQSEEGESNFISEIFFLTLAAHHYGSEAVNSKLKTIDREIKYLEKHITNMEAERHKIAKTPHQLKLFEETLRRHTNVLEKTLTVKLATEGLLLDERMQSTSIRFMRYVSVWLLRLATGTDYKPGTESQTIKLPITMEPDNYFAYLPEYALQNIIDNFKFIFRYLPGVLIGAVGEEMVALCITFLRCSEYIKNPYLKSSLVSLLFSGTWPYTNRQLGILGDHLTSIKFAHDYLLHALMKFYIECESTGAHTQFYDKFNIRYEIFQVIKRVWTNGVYREQLIRESNVNRPFFVQFVNMLLNDTTYVLDEAFTKFPKMRQLERDLESTELSTEERQKKEEELQTLGSQATSYMQLANETLEMMKLFTETLSEAFTMPEIVSRLASMLNYNLETLAGKKAAAELSVSNKEKYHFRPIQLLSDFVDIYLNLGSSQVFIDAVAADGRSFNLDVLAKVSRILVGRNHKDPSDIAKWTKLRAKFAEAKELQDQADLDLGEIPAEFEDPIMGDLMKDPVLLPSKHIVDRSTIMQHLLSDPKDPFTRQPMTIDDAIPQTELKERIEKWRQEKIAEAKNKLQEQSDAMDTAEG